ncbi:DNRLRE domain-containing protein [Myxococcus sp. CA040A]|uniref:CBM96 family carbohydrate-binding protein n=1 Tax=Myxococcus sp. CA040A TaxID=2741738 RepID=UPI00157BACBB|nr:DNRLRE domain-containing protein [Myxococcus sp. CA040A]NTX08160.1 DNRLRE domain-containing protein [Myxococcus sp. CA040A]
MALALLGGCGSSQGEVSASTLDVAPDGQRRDELNTQTVTFIAAADTHVVATSPTTSFGSSPTMEVDRSPESEAYLRFLITPFEGTLTTARLRVYALDGSSDGPTAHDPRLDGRNWNELTTWNTRPPPANNILASAGAVTSGTWIELDISDLHISQNAYTDIHLRPDSTDGVTIASSEHPNAALRPQLVLTVESAEDHPPHRPTPLPVSGPPTLFNASADTYVSEAAPGSSAGGTSRKLWVDNGQKREAYLRFSVQGLTETVQRAILRLNVSDEGTAGGPSVYAIQGAWNESSVTWNTRPQRVGGVLSYVPFLSPLGTVEYDVTDLVRGNGDVSFGLYGNSTTPVTFVSRESSSVPGPQLLVWTGASRTAPGDACLTRREIVSTTLYPLHDTYIDQYRPDTTFHREASLKVDTRPGFYSYLDFDVQLPPGQVRRVLLQLYALEASDRAPRLLKSVPFDPKETTWSHPPPFVNEVLADAWAVKKDEWVEYDVTATVTTSGRHAFQLYPSSNDGLSFASVDASREQILDAAPRLVVVTESAPFCSYRGTQPAGTTTWVKQSNRPEAERAIHTAPAPDGGFAVLSAVEQTQDGPYSAAETDVVTLHRADGGVAWTREFAHPGVTFRKVAVTTLGNVLAAGEYSGAPDLGKGPLPQGRGMFLMKLTPTGAVDWTRGYRSWSQGEDGPEDNIIPVYDLATDAHGSAVVTGGFWGHADFGAGPVYSGKPRPYDDEGPNSFVLKVQWDGAYQWARVLAGQSLRGTQAVSVAVDAQENVTVGGWAAQGTDFGAGAITGQGPFVARWSVSGAPLWAWLLPTTYGHYADVLEVGVLPDGSVAFTGNFDGRFTFAGTSYASLEPDDFYDGQRDALLGRLSATGAEAALRQFQDDRGRSLSFGSLVVDASGNITTTQSGWGRLLGLGSVGLPEDVAPDRPTLAGFAPSLATRWVRVLDPLQSGLHLAPVGDGVIATGSLAAPFELDGTWYTPRLRRLDLLHVKLRP